MSSLDPFPDGKGSFAIFDEKGIVKIGIGCYIGFADGYFRKITHDLQKDDKTFSLGGIVVNKKKWMGIGLAVTMLATSVVGCGNKEEGNSSGETSKMDSKQELNLVFPDEVPTLDISKATNAISFTLFANINEGLVRLDKDGKAVPGLASEWKVSPDGKTYTFKLRDAKWSNGDPVTAHDFEYSWKRTLDPKTAAEYAFMVAWIKNGQAYNEGKASADDVGVKALDDKTLQVELDYPIPFFVEQMAFPIFYAQNKKFVEQQGDQNGADADKVLSNGPFKLTEWVHEQSVTVVKNDTYWDKDKVKLEKVTWQVVKDTNAAVNLYESGQVDRVGLVRDQVDTYKDRKDEYSVQPELTTGYLQYNQKVKALQSAKVRRALTWAIDADVFADTIFHNGTVGATGYTPFGVSDGHGNDFAKKSGDLINRKGNASKAKQTLEEGLKELGLTEFPKIKLLCDDGDVGKKSAEFIKEAWRKNLGIEIDVETVPYKLRLKRSHDHDFDIVLSLWGADYNDPMTFLDMFVTGGSFNDPGWSNKEYDDLISKAKVEPDKKKRMDMLYAAEKLLMEEMPIGPLYFRARAFITKPYVKNFKWSVYGPDYELKETYIEGK
jgi:oligopeptide transport system substrate-binding protein